LVFELPSLTPTTSPPKRTRAGGRLLPGVDFRTSGGRRLRSLVLAHLADLDREATATDHALIKQAAALELQLEDFATRVARGESVSTAAQVSLSRELARIVTALRGERRSGRRAVRGGQ
jgi:hypothetical protein